MCPPGMASDASTSTGEAACRHGSPVRVAGQAVEQRLLEVGVELGDDAADGLAPARRPGRSR